MSNPKDSVIDQETLARHRQVLDDYRGLEKHISPELRAELESTMSVESREPILRFALLAIQYGRSLEQEELVRKLSKAPQYMQVLVKELITTDRRLIIVPSDTKRVETSPLLMQLMGNLNKH